MSKSTYFLQECPTCGRNLNIRVVYLGKRVHCEHCSAPFVAGDSTGQGDDSHGDSGIALLRRAEQLLESSDSLRERPR
ncbi:MAG: response regulator [Planctomycetes bacterium]|nr:response regulator [Planctomycetota bacterium]